MRIDQLDTPAILIDLDVMERNLQRVADYAKRHGLRLRPHTKTHKIPALGKRQLELGAAGLAVAKTTEAEVMLKAGRNDLLIAYPVVGAAKVQRLVELAKKTPVTVAVDSVEAAKPISEAASKAGVEVGVLAEFDVGLGRVGVAPENLPALVKSLVGMPGLKWRGITFYPGHVKKLGEDSEPKLAALRELLPRVLDSLKQEGLTPEIVSGGSTPLLFHSHEVPGLTEIRPGTYVFNDRNTIACGACAREDCAATILTTVVSVQPGRLMLDGGSKTFSSDKLSTGEDVLCGEIVGAPGARFHKLNEEHGYVDTAQCDREFHIGDRVRVLPNHICVAMNLEERVYGVRGDEVVEEWVVEGRGKLQ